MASIGCFRCNATAQIGLGHFVRCAALAEELIRRGWSCRFIVGPQTSPGARTLVSPDIEIVEDANADDPAIVRQLLPHDCDLLVIDSYRLGIDFEKGLAGAARQCLVIDDLPTRPHHCDLFLDQTFGRGSEAYASLLAPHTRRMLGSSYALLRPSFAAERHRAVSRRSAGGLTRVLVSLGGAPQPSALAQVLEGVAQSGLDIEIHVVGGADIASAPDGIRIVRHPQTAAMHDIMSACDAAIGAGGTSAWERCALGLPSIVVQIADNQVDVAAALAAAGAAIDVGPIGVGTAELIANALQGLADDTARLLMANRAAAICDGLGARRVASLIAPARASDGKPVVLRPATREDAKLMFDWQQIEEVRRYANDPRPPAWEDHVRWLDRRLTAPLGGPFSIIEYADRPAGVLRLDHPVPERLRIGAPRTDDYLVSILIDPAFHRLGIAQAALSAGRALLPDAKIYAEVRRDNAASHRLFRTAGFSAVRPDLYVS